VFPDLVFPDLVFCKTCSPKTRTAHAQKGLRRCFFSLFPEYQIEGGQPDIFQNLYFELGQWVREKDPRLGA